MQIILLEKVTNVGVLGDVVKVKDGYARNFLIPQGKAKRATPSNLAEFEQRRADLEKAQVDLLSTAEAKATKLEGLTLVAEQKAGVDGRLFGSVTQHDIAALLVAQGVEVDRGAVRLESGPLKTVGDHIVAVVLHSDVHAQITVTVKAA